MGIPLRQKPWSHIFWPCDLDLWPTTLTYSPNLRAGWTPIPKIKVVGQTVRPWECWQTHRHTGPILWPRPLTREVTSKYPFKKVCFSVMHLIPDFIIQVMRAVQNNCQYMTDDVKWRVLCEDKKLRHFADEVTIYVCRQKLLFCVWDSVCH